MLLFTLILSHSNRWNPKNRQLIASTTARSNSNITTSHDFRHIGNIKLHFDMLLLVIFQKCINILLGAPQNNREMIFFVFVF